MYQANFRPLNLPLAISELRTDGQLPVLDGHFDGGECRVFKADFAGGESWAVRIPLFAQSEHQETVVQLLEAEAEVLRKLDKKGFRWSAKVQAMSPTFDNAVGFPFMALTWIPGTHLTWSFDHPTRPCRNKILGQLAMIQAELIDCTKETRVSATSYFERIIKNKARRIRNGELPGITEQDCSAQKRLLPEVLYASLDGAPFAMCHGDLSPRNIIVDSANNITGIIDWGFSEIAPMQLAAEIPRLLRLEPPNLPPTPCHQRDRNDIVASLVSLPPRYAQVVSWMTTVQDSADADFRACVLESVKSKGMHEWMARHNWKLPQS